METTGFFKEKRQNKRVELHLPIKYRIMTNNQFNNALSLDVSNKGLRIATEDFMPTLSDIFVQLNLFSMVIELIARVIWSKRVRYSDKFQFGLEFLEVDLTKRRYLEDYLALHE